MVTSFLLLSTILTLTAQDKPYHYFLSGNAENVDVRGLGIDEKTAVLLEPDGKAKVVGTESAFFLTLREKPALQRRTAARYTLWVERGAVESSLAGGGQYR